jgi:hypothetical protein
MELVKVKRSEVEVTIKLNKEDLNLLVSGLGLTNALDRTDFGVRHGLEIDDTVHNEKGYKLYRELKTIAFEIDSQ